MNPLFRGILRWIAYLIIGVGVLGALFGVIGLAEGLLGSPANRGNNLGGAVGSLGGGFANVLLGYGLLWVSRSGINQPKT